MLWRLRTSWLSCQSSGTCEHCPGSWPMKWPRLRGCSTFDAQWPKGQEGSILQLNVRSAGAQNTHFPSVVAHGFLRFLSMKLRDWNSGSRPVMNEMLSRDVFLDQTAPSHRSMRIRTLCPDPWLLSPFSSSPLDTSRASLFTPSLSLVGQLTSSRHMFLVG